MEIVIAIIALLAGGAIGYLLAGNKKSALLAKNEMLEQQIVNQRSQSELQMATQHEQMERQMGMQREQMEQQLEAQRVQMEQQMKAQREQMEQQLSAQREQMEQQMNLVREQMNTASEKILKERSEELSATNREQLAAILNPLRSEIVQMKETVDKSGREHATSMERLDASIKANIERSNVLSERADKLAQALTGDNKSQGDFGELKLKHILEGMGLEEGVQFEEQTTLKDAKGNTVYEEDGHRLIPDVILHFPDERDVVIDSKMSLTAYVDYKNAENEEDRQEALKRHITSVRAHANELAKKNYSKYLQEGRGKLDFVLMYVYHESALQLALANSPTLWKEAYDNGVVISGSQNLYMMLRVLEMTWKQVRQVENQQSIMECANTIIDRVQLFYERFLKVEEQLEKTKKAFDEVKTVTAPTGLSVVTAANKLLKFGATENPKRKQRLPKASDEEEK
ncbi:MAG: DNA recombination protein RmuC [Prevotellaceae bacterium]|nr:DNA recombination protein RmuC [Candidatus Minthosoma caballi]